MSDGFKHKFSDVALKGIIDFLVAWNLVFV